MSNIRSRAAKALKKEDGYSSIDIDDVLDFFEDLGFYMQGDQATPEAIHHTFYYWIRGYYSAARDYLEKAQEERPTQWEFVKELFETTHEIEIERNKSGENSFDLKSFLGEEINLVSVKKPSSR